MSAPGNSADDSAEMLAREAAAWFARMRAPDAGGSQSAFDAWLARSPAHRGAYNRAAEIFAMGKLLADASPAARPRPSRRVLQMTLAMCVVCALTAIGWVAWRSAMPVRGPIEIAAGLQDRRSVVTVAGETRLVRLADGSILRLAGATAIEVAFDAGRRTLRLARGEARFEVAHEARPFVVLAGGGSVTARGTVFDVALAPAGQVDVRLIEGVVDVRLPDGPSDRGARPVRRLAAGESVSFAPSRAASGAPGAMPAFEAGSGSGGIPAAREFTGITVAALLEAANRTAARPVRLADASLGGRRVSGRFRVDDTALLAERLAALLDGRVDRSDPREIVLGP